MLCLSSCERFGRLDGCFHTAGGSGRRFGDGPLHEVSLGAWDQTFRLNLTTEFLVTLPNVLVLVDGYNVAKLTWPDLSLAEQRDRMLDAADTVARRYGSEIAVIFDGADVIGAHAAQRRLARVGYSPAGITADDMIRAEV